MHTVLYTAAHGGFRNEAVPLGGGAAVFEHLVDEWDRTRPFTLHAITPSILGVNAPSGGDLVGFSEQTYAQFSRAFEHAATEEILKHDPSRTTVLVNDVSEGPDFERLAARGFRIFTIYHVDVVAYVSAIYLRGWLRPRTTVALYRKLGRWLPEITELVWKKQEASVVYSTGLIVPSSGMKDVLLDCYPECALEKIHVLPWGSWSDVRPRDPAARARLRAEFGVPAEARVLLTLSRISPEKGQDLLLNALEDAPNTWLFICGDAAFMKGREFLHRVRARAAMFKHTKVVFPGYVSGDRKRAFFDMADLYVFPSRHESYGLTLIEALAAGLPAVCLDHLGARSVMRPEFGAIVSEEELGPAITRLLSDPAAREKMSEEAQRFAASERFSTTAEKLAALIGQPRR